MRAENLETSGIKYCCMIKAKESVKQKVQIYVSSNHTAAYYGFYNQLLATIIVT
jgi:hypothetical protein